MQIYPNFSKLKYMSYVHWNIVGVDMHTAPVQLQGIDSDVSLISLTIYIWPTQKDILTASINIFEGFLKLHITALNLMGYSKHDTET